MNKVLNEIIILGQYKHKFETIYTYSIKNYTFYSFGESKTYQFINSKFSEFINTVEVVVSNNCCKPLNYKKKRRNGLDWQNKSFLEKDIIKITTKIHIIYDPYNLGKKYLKPVKTNYIKSL